MKKNIIGVKFFNEVLIIALASLMIFTPFYKMQRMYILILLFSAWFFSTVLMELKWYWKKNAIIAIVILILMVALDAMLWNVTGDYTYFNSCITHKFFVYIWFLIFLFYTKHIDILKKIMPIIMLLILISAVITLVGNITNSGASRLLAGTSDYYAAMREQYRNAFIGGYDLIYALVFMLMPLLLMLRNKIKGCYIALFMACSFIVTVVISSYFIGILLSVAFVLCIIFKPKRIGRYFAIMLCILLIVILAKDYLLEGLVNIGNAIGSDILVKRANEMITMSYVTDYGEGNRLVIYHNAILNYLDHPFLGTLQGSLKNHRRSGHSALLVYLESYGLLSIVYYGFLFKIFKTTKNCLKNIVIRNSYKIYYGIFLIFMFVDIFDTAYAMGCVVLFVAPAMLLIIDEEVNGVKCNPI